jgi:hypothetical protein
MEIKMSKDPARVSTAEHRAALGSPIKPKTSLDGEPSAA